MGGQHDKVDVASFEEAELEQKNLVVDEV